jgi:hypothetical protein
MKRTLYIFLLVILPICVFSQGKHSNRNKSKKDNNLICYFPSDSSSITPFEQKWYSKQLLALNEPIIFCSDSIEVYRFTWLRTFHNPISIRIQKSDNKYFLILKMTNGAGGYEPGILIKNEEKEISESDWNQFKEKLNDLHFFKLITHGKYFDNKDIIPIDGAEWILEARIPDKYKVTTRWCPKDNNYSECCLFLLNLSGLIINKDEIY